MVRDDQQVNNCSTSSYNTRRSRSKRSFSGSISECSDSESGCSEAKILKSDELSISENGNSQHGIQIEESNALFDRNSRMRSCDEIFNYPYKKLSQQFSITQEDSNKTIM